MESKLYKRVKENLPNCTITKIENRASFYGISDLLLAFSGIKLALMELKFVKVGKKIRFSPHQIAFQLKHKNLPSFILVEWKPKDLLLLYHANQMEDLLEKGCDTKPLVSYPMKKIMWNMLRLKLIN